MPKMVLVVDDSSTMRSILELNVKKIPGVKVVMAKTGVEAMEKFNAEPPALVLTDINMPDMNGFQLIETIRKAGSKTPIVCITTRGEDTDRDKALSLGANAYVCKPINGQEVVETLERLLPPEPQ